ncbi:MAG TPA: VOC family protein [Planctomycetaceae bacterium]|nr:VOC family protein [Planctomycetaceae bacterium]
MTDSNASRLAALTAPICCSLDQPPPGTRFHCAINVADLARSVEFYRILFGVRPARQEVDYAKFELSRPPLVFSLIPQAPGMSRGLRHLAFPVHHPAEVEALGTRLTTAGLAVTWQRNALLDDARQTAVQCVDPDGNVWRISCRLQDLDTVNTASSDSVNGTKVASSPTPSVGWEHRILSPCPERIPHADGSVDFVRLEGTFNAELTNAQRAGLLSEVYRVLKPGGIVQAHGLAANCVLPMCPVLHGVAALVRRVPVESEPLEELRAAGFHDIQITKLPAKAAFQCDAVQLRELKLSAWKPANVDDTPGTVVYRGPGVRIVTDSGRVFSRGVPTTVDAAVLAALQAEPWRGQFLLMDEAGQCEAVVPTQRYGVPA